ncbi:MAG: YhcH/YjgK/YiaL family protein [Lachnospiraceae bacterium]|nr:YhcH/YjgK/YiaL family protein [Lachnospiraceae bacterium]MBP3594376.1 YhcH/YjgK/YiaL family protein [Lachnospiraceae bacterium]
MRLFDLNNVISEEDKAIKACLDFLRSKNGSDIENGKHLVDGDGIFVNISEYTTRLLGEGKWEAHKVYADLQILLEGIEYINVSDIRNMETGEFNQESDFVPCNGEIEESYLMNPKKALLLMPEDAHMPGICVDNNPTRVKKAVFKIPVECLK